MRIGLFTDTYLPDINGVVSSTVILKNALQRAGHTVFVVTNHSGSGIEMEDGVLQLPGLTLKGLYGYKMSSPFQLRADAYIKNMNLDVIHLQTNFGVGIYGQTIAHSLGIPLVNTYHTMYEDYTHYINPRGFQGFEKISREAIRAASRNVCNHCQAIISPSVKTKEILTEYGVEAPIYVVPTGLDLTAFASAYEQPEKIAQCRRKITEDPDAKILLFLGRIAKEKSLEMPIEAFLKSQDPKMHLAIVGAGPDEDYYRELASNHPRIHFLGKADPSQVPFWYAGADAFVSASLSETQGMTYLEAMATGRMVFGRRDEVLNGLLQEGKTGYYFDSAKELLEKAEQFYALSEQQLKENALTCQQVTAPYTDVTFAHKVAAVYDQAILDYSRTYEVDKIRIVDDFVWLTLYRDSAREPVKILIPLEDCFACKISMHTKLDAYMVDAYEKKQRFYQGCRILHRKAENKDITFQQVVRYGRLKLELSDEEAKDVAVWLEHAGLIDDRAYALDKAEYWQHQGYSRGEIRRKLAKAGIASDLIDEASSRMEDTVEKDNAVQLARRLMNTVKAKSSALTRQTLVRKVMARGFGAADARAAVEGLELSEEQEQEALAHAVAKARRLYASRPEKEAEEKLYRYCRNQGFSARQISEFLESEDAEDED